MPDWFDPRNAGPDVSSRKGADIAGCADTLLSCLFCVPLDVPASFRPGGLTGCMAAQTVSSHCAASK
jgi:hypothetical protein